MKSPRLFRRLALSYIQKYWIVLTIVAMAITYILTMILAQGESIWFDESYSIILAKRSIHDLLALTAVDAHPPLYYLYLKIWGSLFGWSEFALRSGTAVLGALSIGMVAVIVRQLFSRKVAVAILPFVVVAPFFLRYNYELRMYALATLIGLVATWALLNGVKTKDKRWWVLYAVMVAAGMYTLYVTAVIWIAHLLWLVITKPGRNKPSRALLRHPAFLAYVGSVILFLPYLPTFLSQLRHSALPGVGTQVTLDRLVGIFGLTISYRSDWEINGWLSIALTVLFVSGGYIFAKIMQHGTQTQKNTVLLLSLLIVVPICVFAVASLGASPIFIDRYMAHITIYGYILLGLLAVIGRKYASQTSIVFGLLLIALLIEGVLHLQQVGNFNLEQQRRFITEQVRQSVDCNKTTTVVADDMYTYINSAYYFNDCNLHFYSATDAEGQGGYAPLRGSAARIDSADRVTTSTLVHLYWQDVVQMFHPTSNYKLIKTQTFNQQVVDTYQKN